MVVVLLRLEAVACLPNASSRRIRPVVPLIWWRRPLMPRLIIVPRRVTLERLVAADRGIGVEERGIAVGSRGGCRVGIKYGGLALRLSQGLALEINVAALLDVFGQGVTVHTPHRLVGGCQGLVEEFIFFVWDFVLASTAVCLCPSGPARHRSTATGCTDEVIH